MGIIGSKYTAPLFTTRMMEGLEDAKGHTCVIAITAPSGRKLNRAATFSGSGGNMKYESAK